MKKTFFPLLALLLALTACGEKAPAPFDPAADAAALLAASGVFTDSLTEIDQATACAFYGIDESTVTGCAVYMANATSAQELAIFTLTDADAAQAATKQLGYRVEDRTDQLRDYLPGALPSLEKAVVETRGASVLLVIAADYAGVEAFLGK